MSDIDVQIALLKEEISTLAMNMASCEKRMSKLKEQKACDHVFGDWEVNDFWTELMSKECKKCDYRVYKNV